MKTTLITCACISVAFTAAILNARPAAFNDPAVRQKTVEELRQKQKAQKAEAVEWAKKNNQPVRETVKMPDGAKVTYELMALDPETKRPLYYMTHNVNAAISTAADQIRDTLPYNVNGSGVTVGVWDAGSVLSNHQEFGSRITVKDGSADNFHATHVGGTIAAAGVDANAEGMAPEALIYSYDWNTDEAEMTAVAASAPAQAGKIYVSNHSYGAAGGWRGSGTHWYWDRDINTPYDYNFGRYSSSVREWDEIIYNAPYYLVCKSSGNDRNDGPTDGETVYYYDGANHVPIVYTNTLHPKGDGVYKVGYDCITTKGNAKNILTVGATLDAVSGGTRDPASGTITSFSSWGPADDGRIKPDVVGNGYELISTYNVASNAYATMSGTSMSSPNVAGSAALLLNVYDNEVGSGAMRASTLKGLLIHTADDIGNAGPDYVYGWGLVNVKAAADTIKAGYDPVIMSALIDEQRLDAGNNKVTYTQGASGTEDLAVTICWTDPPGTWTGLHDSRTPVLVNDLDLLLIAPDGTTNHPYVLDYSNPSALATTGDNIRDNVEQVRIASPQTTGQYTIEITYKGTLTDAEQHCSIIMTGIVPEPGFAIIIFAGIFGLIRRFYA